MNDKQLRCFLTLCETLNYRKAAEMLYIAQSALSRYIQSLEDEVGMQLFVRSPKKVELTPAGEVLAVEFKNLRIRINDALLQAKDAEYGFIGEIRVGVLPGLAFGKYSSLFLDYNQLHSNIRFKAVSKNIPDLAEMLHTGELDIAICPQACIEAFPELCFCELMRKELRLYYVPESMKLKRGSTPELSAFRDSNVVVFSRQDTAGMRIFTQMCMDAGFAPRFDYSTKGNPDLTTAMAMMQTGNNVAILHENIFWDGDTFCSIALSEIPPTTIGIAWNSERCAPRVEAFVSYITTRMQWQNKGHG